MIIFVAPHRYSLRIVAFFFFFSFSSRENAEDAAQAADSRVVAEILPNPLRTLLRGGPAGQRARRRQEGMVVRALRRPVRGAADGTASRQAADTTRGR